MPEEHEHLVRVGMPGILCVCRACRLLLSAEGAGHGKFKAVPDRWVGGRELSLDDEQWMRLGIPVRIAFFVLDSSRGHPIGFYPSPGGAIEAELDDGSRRDLSSTAGIGMLEPDVEAWLVDGRDRDAATGWVVPLNAAYELVARLRMAWEGFTGGPRARDALESFFERARRNATENARPV